MQERFETFTVLINRISRNIKKIKKQEMVAYNLKSVHVSCLYYIFTLNGATSTDLCERCEEDKATISRALDYLDMNGYITREVNSIKRYKNPILLTDKGYEIGKKITDKINIALDNISGGLTEKERIEFYRCLSVVSESLENLSKNLEK